MWLRVLRRSAQALDLVVCDEAHRTTGVTLSGNDESAFVRIHDPGYLAAAKRLYMTATPRVFGDAVRQRADEANAVLADMDDESMYGPELHRLGFGEAVDANLLSDYKVLVLAVDEEYVAKNFQQAMAEAGEIKLDDAARLIGCWNGLAKRFGDDTAEEDRTPMRTAVAFARNIKMSKLASESFPVLVDRARQYEGGVGRLRVEARHVDGTMGIHTRNEHLRWLSSRDAGEGVCRILTNAKCLSEGVDVPALDAVLFLTPRGSQVDVVQSVGRVMRRAPGKTHGYIILPVVVPSGVAPEEALRDNERYRVVWQVLQALRSHDDRFHAMVNSIELNKTRPDTLIIDAFPPPDFEGGDGDLATGEQLGLDLSFEGFRDAMYARIVQKVGERTYWEQWAGDVAQIAQTHIARITALLEDQGSPQAKEFERFLDGLRGNLNESIAAEDAIEMLAQHLITRPIFEALFAGYDFAASNPVAQAMEQMLAELDEHNITAEVATLERFYASVRRRVEGVDNADGRQRILVELYDKFFAAAFKRTVDRLGIVYTPVEVVDFILRSADAVLRDEFGYGLTEEGVHILDPFTGTGTFVVRLLQSGLIHPADLARKYGHELHANEILLLAYYIAAVNIETTYRDVAGEIVPFPGLVFADTFQAHEDGDRLDVDIFPANNERMTRQMGLPLKVIVGNPPYSAGQDSANDDNANESYTTLDAAIRSTYAQRSSARRVGSLYDSYVRAIKWATLRLGNRGVIAYVTNGGFLDSNSADGLRKTLADEFSAIHIFNLRGNARTVGEDRKREAGSVFGAGSKATVAITVLVRNPEAVGPVRITYADIGDYLSREEKLEKIAEAATIMDVATRTITPNEHGDWLDQRREDFERHLPLVAGKEPGIFAMATAGLKTNRDAWNYNASRAALVANTARTIAFYNTQVEVVAGGGVISRDPQQISWDRVPLRDVERGKTYAFNAESVAKAAYRPFYRLWAYPDRQWNNTVYRIPAFFPRPGLENVGFFVNDPVPANKPAVLMLDAIPDHHVYGKGGTFVARWRYEPVASEGQLDITAGDEGDVVGGFRRIDNVTDQALQAFQACYPDAGVSKGDVFHYVYAVLHSAEYREIYASDLKKTLPRIPFVSDFEAYVTAGAALAELHLGYETVEPYALEGVPEVPVGDPYEFYSVGARMRFGRATAGQALAGERHDRTTIVFNDHITISGIPADAHRYVLGPRSAIEWFMDRFYVRTDRSSGIVNDPNESSRERGEPRYILDLIGRIVTVSVETMRIVDSLPPLAMIDPKRDRRRR